ncbi:MAG: hypothetical protein IKP09_01970, partial [Lentisphaeria bacterium]|nr:hypothetical protein [Lentisphaeria bacterium]
MLNPFVLVRRVGFRFFVTCMDYNIHRFCDFANPMHAFLRFYRQMIYYYATEGVSLLIRTLSTEMPFLFLHQEAAAAVDHLAGHVVGIRAAEER